MPERIQKEMKGEKILRTFHVARGEVIKAIKGQIPGMITKAEGEGEEDDQYLYAYASVEVTDTCGDIVRIAGIETDQYHNPPTTHLKILAQHRGSSVTTGESFVIGRVEEFYRVKVAVGDQMVPALAFKMKWNTTPLSDHYRKQFKEKFLDSFSVGMIVLGYEVIRDREERFCGYDFTRTMLMETSAVSIPANPFANAIQMEADTETAGVVKGLSDVVEALRKQVEEQAQKIAGMSELGTKICELGQLVEGAVKGLTESLDERLDVIESALVAKSKAPPATGDQEGRAEQTNKLLKDLDEVFKKYVPVTK